MSYETLISRILIAGAILIAVIGYTSLPVKISFALLGVVFLFVGIIFLIKERRVHREVIEKRYEKIAKKGISATPEFAQRWETIRFAMRSNDLNELRVAIVDADTLLEELLRQQGIEGDTMSSLISEAIFFGIIGMDRLSSFHRLRNRIVHESTFQPQPHELRDALQALDAVLVAWGVVLPRKT